MLGSVVAYTCASGNDYHFKVRDDPPEITDEFSAFFIICHIRIYDDAVHLRKTYQTLKCFVSIVGGDHVQFCSFDHQLSSRNTSRKLSIHNDEAGPFHLTLDARCDSAHA